MVKELNYEELKLEIEKKEKIVVDCYAPWCGPCRMLSPIIDQLAEENKNVIFYKVNIDDNEELAKKYGIMSIPTILFFEKNEFKSKVIGLKSKKELEELIKM